MVNVNIKATSGIIAATLVGLGVVWLSTATAYWTGTIASSRPWSTFGLVFAIALGIAAISFYPFKSVSSRVVVTVIYISGLCASLFFTALLTACGYGDCL